jgi:L-lactate dehydrogenase complex protein LldG
VEREQFLGRVRAALRGAVLPEATGPGAAPSIEFDDPVSRFIEQATKVAAEVTVTHSAADAVDAVAGILDGRPYIAWDDLDAVVTGWEEAVVSRGWERIDATVDATTRHADHARIGAVPVGITSADVAIAATGTVVVTHGDGRPRSASVLVEDHIVLLPADRIVPSLADGFERVDWDTSNVVAITGPSRTGDIESILTLGVHGPRRLHIVVIG